MKSLLYKDLLNLKLQLKLYLVIVGLWLVIGIYQKSPSFLGGVLAVFSVMLPLTAYAYDERAGWDKYALTMPMRRLSLVLSKYVLAILALLVSMVLTSVLEISCAMPLEEMITINGAFFSIALVALSVLLPVMFRFGTEKGRIVLMIVFLVPMLIGLTLGQTRIPMPDEQQILLLMKAAPVGSVLILLLSVAVSVHVFRKKEF